MIDVEQRLTEMLDQRAEACRPQSRLDEILGTTVEAHAEPDVVNIHPKVHDRRRTIVGVAAALALVIGGAAIAAVVATQRSDNRSAGSIVATPTATATDASAVPRLDGPRPVADPGGVFAASAHTDRIVVGQDTRIAGSSVRVAQIVPYLDGYVAVGTTRVGFRAEASVWRSNDAMTWTRVADGALQTAPIESPSISYGWSIVRLMIRGKRLVAVGYAVGDNGGQITSWVSDDGDHWTRHTMPVPPNPRLSVTGAVATDDSFMISVFENTGDQSGSQTRSLIIRSADGVDWVEQVAQPLNALGTHVFGLTTFDGKVIAYGSTDGNKGIAAMWASADGRNWVTSKVFPPTRSDSTAFVAAASTTDGAVFVSRLLGDGVSALRVWSSRDGITLNAIPVGALNGTSADSPDELGEIAVSDGPAGVLLSVTRQGLNHDHRTTLWLVDGDRLTLRQVSDVPVDLAPISALAPVGDGYLAATASGRPRGSASLWVIAIR